MSQPRVSIITRTFNRPDMLRRALKSVGEQTWENREVVVINDGGCDVQEVLDELAPHMPRGAEDIVYLNFTPENKPGRCLAQARGIEASTGEWICYLDDDDFYYPDHLETLMEAAGVSGAKVLYTDANHGTEEPVGPNGEYEITTVGPGPSEDFSRAAFYVGCYIHLVTFCHHRSIYDSHGGFDPDITVLEDLDFFFRLAQDYDFEHIRKVTAQFQIRTDKTNAVTSMHREFVETREKLLKKYLHSVIRDLMVYVHEGRGRIEAVNVEFAAMKARILRLERELEALKESRT